MENAVGFLRRNLLVPVPEAPSLEALNAMLREGCERLNAQSSSRDGRPTMEAFQEDLAGMLELPGVPFDAVRWAKAKSDKMGYVRVDGSPYCAGPAWHDRELMVGVRAGTVEVLADRARHVATLRRSFRGGRAREEPRLAHPRPHGAPARLRRVHHQGGHAGSPGGCHRPAGQGRQEAGAARARQGRGGVRFAAACEAEERIFGEGRIPDEASCDMLARRIAQGRLDDGAGPDLAIYDGFITREEV